MKSDKRTRKDSKSSDKKDYRKDSKLGKGKDRKHTKSVVKDDRKAANSDRKADQKVKNDGDKKEKHQEAQKDVAKESANNIVSKWSWLCLLLHHGIILCGACTFVQLLIYCIMLKCLPLSNQYTFGMEFRF